MPASRTHPLHLAFPAAAGGAAAALLTAAGPPSSVWGWRLVVGAGGLLAGLGATVARQRLLVGAGGRSGGDEDALAPASRAPRRARPAIVGEPGSDPLGAVLGDIRDALGATEAVLWRVSPAGDGLYAAAWASGADDPQVPLAADVLPVIAWSAHERVVQCHSATNGGSYGTAPVVRGGELLGALSVHAAAALRGERATVKEWLGRYARQLGELVELVETRLEFERQSQHSQRLLQAAQDFQSLRSVEELGRAVCAAAVEVSAAQRAALVRWDRRSGSGRVESACGYRRIAAGLPLDADSTVSAVCREGVPQVWEDARRLEGAAPVFCAAEPERAIASLGIVPIVGRDGVSAAVVLESDVPGAISVRDVRSVKLLTAMSAVTLDTLGDFEIAEREANTDQLTGLGNRRALEAQFGPTLDRADRFGETLAVVLCDVDHFKRVNDTHGHEVGDEVLQAVAKTLARGVRGVDLCVRFGGEEFLLLLPHTGEAGAFELAERLRRAVEARPVRVGAKELHVTASFGIAMYPGVITDRDDLVPAADRALYQAKADGRNCVRLADTSRARD